MDTRRLASLMGAFVMIWAFALSVSLLVIWLVVSHRMPAAWLILPVVLIVFAVADSIQKKHAIRRNYPIAGRIRYLFESIRPELRQYFFESELDGKPFSRRQRSIVYQRAKNEPQTVAFGMQDDPQRTGIEWISHTNYPKVFDTAELRVTIGGTDCSRPYNASILNIGAMSYGALSKAAITALNRGALQAGFAHNTGEGGISAYHLSGGDLIWQIGTGYFGCRDTHGGFDLALFTQNTRRPEVKMIEIKISQGAKPGHGGLLPAKKNTEEIAAIRGVTPGTAIHSPAGHTAFTDSYSLLRFVHRLREASGGKPVGFKLCIGRKNEFETIVLGMKETGLFPDFITIDGGEGGTGAAPLEFMDYAGMPLHDALAFVHATLKGQGIREEVKLIASGKIITAFDMIKAMALGADLCYSARGMMFALGCIQALKCDSGKCPVGIATQEKMLYKGLDVEDKYMRVARFHENTLKAFADFMGSCGYSSLAEISAEDIFRRISPSEVSSLKDLYFPKFNDTSISKTHEYENLHL